MSRTILGEPLPIPRSLAEARLLLNRRVEELNRNNGIIKPSDLTIGEAVDAIKVLTNTPNPPRRVQVTGDRQVIKKARWHQASLLEVYLERSPEFERDSYQVGVYDIFELVRNQRVPLFVEALPRYPGMSKSLSQRLRGHASGSFSSGKPAETVIRQFLQTCTQGEQAAYAVASKAEQRELRRLAMARRRLWVKTTHCANKKEADALEHATIRWYRAKGYELWNDIDYHTGT